MVSFLRADEKKVRPKGATLRWSHRDFRSVENMYVNSTKTCTLHDFSKNHYTRWFV